MSGDNVDKMTDKKSPKHISIQRALIGLKICVEQVEALADKISNTNDETKQAEKDEPPLSLEATLNETPDRIDVLGKRIQEALAKIRQKLF
jgi:hypothetical protein